MLPTNAEEAKKKTAETYHKIEIVCIGNTECSTIGVANRKKKNNKIKDEQQQKGP